MRVSATALVLVFGCSFEPMEVEPSEPVPAAGPISEPILPAAPGPAPAATPLAPLSGVNPPGQAAYDPSSGLFVVHE